MAKKEVKVVSFRYNLREYFSFIGKYKLLFFFLLLTIFLVEIISVGEKYLFKHLIDTGTEFEKTLLLSSEFVNFLFVTFFIYLSMVIITIVVRWCYENFLIALETNLIKDLKIKYFNHILSLDYNFHTTHKTGSLISRLGRGASSIERITDSIVFNFAPLLFQLFAVSFTLIYLDLTSAVVIFFVVVAFVCFCFYIQKLQIPSNIEKNNSEDIEKANVSDIFTNIDTVKYFGKEKVIKNRFEKLSDITRKNTKIHWNYYRWLASGENAIIGVGTILILYFPMVRLLHNEISLGTLTFIYTVYVGLIPPLRSFVHGMRDLYRCMADFEDLFQYGRIRNEVVDIPYAKDLSIKKGEIEFRNIYFCYGKRCMFENLNIKIKPNEKVAFVGHSGSGKTTLIKLLYRLYDITSGQILIDGKNIRNYRQESLRSSMSIVPQECILFDDSIYNNVAFSSPKSKKGFVLSAMRQAQLDKLIDTFPNKEKTIVGERGVRLSGGEKQRVSVARALLANKKILILDEATSALDSQIEHDIQKALINLMKDRTSIVIAHRLSTIMYCDRIIVLCHGKIVQEGTHEQLISQEGEYKKLWTLQKGGYI